MPSSDNGKHKIAAPYLLANGIKYFNLSGSALTELMSALPGYAFNPASNALTSLVSMASGVFTS